MKLWDNIMTSLKARKGEFLGTSGNEEKISKKINSGNSVNISNPTSQRTFTKGEQTRNNKGQFEKRSYTTGNIDIGDTTDQYSKKDYAKTGEVVSSAISNFEYDPKTGLANITFVGGEKPYEYKMTPEEVDQFINTDSKGRFVAKKMNHNPHFRSPNY